MDSYNHPRWTYQALMNHIFGEHMGKFMNVYLDNIIMYLDTLEDHVAHVETVLQILGCKSLFLSEKKLQFLCKDVKILRWTITDEGIQMDPEKVNKIMN